jgi:hypothetical protein
MQHHGTTHSRPHAQAQHHSRSHVHRTPCTPTPSHGAHHPQTLLRKANPAFTFQVVASANSRCACESTPRESSADGRQESNDQHPRRALLGEGKAGLSSPLHHFAGGRACPQAHDRTCESTPREKCEVGKPARGAAAESVPGMSRNGGRAESPSKGPFLSFERKKLSRALRTLRLCEAPLTSFFRKKENQPTFF